MSPAINGPVADHGCRECHKLLWDREVEFARVQAIDDRRVDRLGKIQRVEIRAQRRAQSSASDATNRRLVLLDERLNRLLVAIAATVNQLFEGVGRIHNVSGACAQLL